MTDFVISEFNNPPIGYLVIQGNIRIALDKPINRFHKIMLNLFFGWKYEPYQKGGKE